MRVARLTTANAWGSASSYLLARASQFDLAVPHLTLKEKLKFDQAMPTNKHMDSEDLQFELKQKEIEAYVSILFALSRFR
jgi:hypothetical protein